MLTQRQIVLSTETEDFSFWAREKDSTKNAHEENYRNVKKRKKIERKKPRWEREGEKIEKKHTQIDVSRGERWKKSLFSFIK